MTEHKKCLKSKYLRRIRQNRIAGTVTTAGAVAVITASFTVITPYASMGGILLLMLAARYFYTTGVLILAMGSPFFVLAEIRHDLGSN